MSDQVQQLERKLQELLEQQKEEMKELESRFLNLRQESKRSGWKCCMPSATEHWHTVGRFFNT